MGWFNGLSLLWRIVTVLGVLAGLGAAAWGIEAAIEARGYERAELKWTIKYQHLIDDIDKRTTAEINRQARVNAEAKAEEEAALEEQRLKTDAATRLAIRLADEAANDPNRDNIALDAEAIARHKRRIHE